MDAEQPTIETILLGVTGSKAYGTNTESSDTDYRGVYVPDEIYYFGLGTAKEYNNSSGGANKNTKHDIDITLTPLKTFVSRCIKANPIDLELLFLRRDDYVEVTPIGEELLENRHLFLSKHVKNRFGGMASSLERKMTKGSRVDETLGYDTKTFMHSVRLYQIGIEILKIGDFSAFRPNHEELKELRAGKLYLSEAREYLKKLDSELADAYETSHLPDRADSEKVEDLLVRITKDYLGYST